MNNAEEGDHFLCDSTFGHRRQSLPESRPSLWLFPFENHGLVQCLEHPSVVRACQYCFRLSASSVDSTQSIG